MSTSEYFIDELHNSDNNDNIDNISYIIDYSIPEISQYMYDQLIIYTAERDNMDVGDIMYGFSFENTNYPHSYTCKNCGHGRLSQPQVTQLDEINFRNKCLCGQCGRVTNIISFTIICDCINKSIKQMDTCYECWLKILQY